MPRKSKKKLKPYGPTGLLSFQRRFPDEQSCWSYLINNRWPKGIECRKCHSKKLYLISKRKLYECADCGAQTSPTAGTILHRSHLPLRKWFWAIFLMSTSKKGVPAAYLQQHLEIGSYRAAWLMCHKIRLAMSQREQTYGQFDGTVQVDQIFIGGKQSAIDRSVNGSNKSAFLIAVKEGPGSKPALLSFEPLGEKPDQDVVPAINKRIAKGSLIKGDAANIYAQLPGLGYQIRVIPQRKKKFAEVHLKWVNTLTSNLKRYLLSTHHGISPKYRHTYLNEFAYRFNRRQWPAEAFDRLLFACANAQPKTLPELKA